MVKSLFPIVCYFLFSIGILCCVPSILSQTSDPTNEKIHVGDLIEVDELGGFDHDWRGRLDPDGFLDGFTKIAEPVFGLCKTPNQLSQVIRDAYARTLRDPKVVVRILDRSQRPVAILDGAIRQPMRLQLRRPVKLSELAVIGGGFTDKASGEITILRPPNLSCESQVNTTTITKVRISEILAGDQEANLTVRSGDLVTVGSVEPVYVIGGVSRPGKLDWREGATLSRVVAAAGGVSDRGVSGNVTIYRRGDASSVVIEADLDDVTSSRAKDIEIRPYDIIDVPVRGEPKRTSPPVADTGETPVRQGPLPLRVIN